MFVIFLLTHTGYPAPIRNGVGGAGSGRPSAGTAVRATANSRQTDWYAFYTLLLG